jgi:fucose permease
MALQRDRATLLAYTGLGLLGFVLNGFGPVLPNLQEKLDLTRSEVARYPTLYAVGWLLMSAAGHRVVKRIGRDLSLRLSATGLGMAAGLMGLALSRLTVGVAAVVMGATGALMMIVVQAFLSDHHGSSAVAAISEANAVSSLAAIAGPVAVASGIAVGLGWAAGFAGPALVVGALLGLGLVASLPGSVGAAAANASPQEEPTEIPWVGSWFGIVLVVALEFAFVFWATDYMDSVAGLPAALAAALTAMFFVGMAAARALGVVLLRLLDPRRRALLGGLAVAALGFAVFWAAPFVAGTPLWSAAGLLIAGAGVAYLFPLSFLGLVGILVGGTDKASARASLASGVAIGVAPLLLGIAADAMGLTTALLLIPILILASAVNVAAVYLRP